MCEVLKLDGDRIRIDCEVELRAAQSAGLQTGGKLYQPSRAKQQYGATLTRLRNQRLQEMATELWQEHTTWKKTVIAEAILASGKFKIARGRPLSDLFVTQEKGGEKTSPDRLAPKSRMWLIFSRL